MSKIIKNEIIKYKIKASTTSTIESAILYLCSIREWFLTVNLATKLFRLYSDLV
jgi:hypothetical protein